MTLCDTKIVLFFPKERRGKERLKKKLCFGVWFGCFGIFDVLVFRCYGVSRFSNARLGLMWLSSTSCSVHCFVLQEILIRLYMF